MTKNAFSADTTPQVGKSAPAFELADIDGKRKGLSDFRGRVVLINFWATWCAPCRAEMPSLDNLYKMKNKDGLVVLAISTDSSERAVRSFITDKAITFPVLMDKDQEVYFDLYAALVMPTSFLIDRKGIIREKLMGEIKWDSQDIKNKIEKLLKEK